MYLAWPLASLAELALPPSSSLAVAYVQLQLAAAECKKRKQLKLNMLVAPDLIYLCVIQNIVDTVGDINEGT